MCFSDITALLETLAYVQAALGEVAVHVLSSGAFLVEHPGPGEREAVHWVGAAEVHWPSSFLMSRVLQWPGCQHILEPFPWCSPAGIPGAPRVGAKGVSLLWLQVRVEELLFWSMNLNNRPCPVLKAVCNRD